MNLSGLFRLPLALVGRLVEVFVKARGLQREFDAFAAVPAESCPTPRGRGGGGEAVSASPGDAPASPPPTTQLEPLIVALAPGFELHLSPDAAERWFAAVESFQQLCEPR